MNWKTIENVCSYERLPRDRARIAVIATPTRIERFTGERIEGFIENVVRTAYEKNGKWSKAYYSITIPANADVLYLEQDFGTGRFINNYKDEFAMRSELGLEDYPITTVLTFIQKWMSKAWERFEATQAKLEELENKGGYEVEFERTKVSRRLGETNLLLNGEHVQTVQLDRNNLPYGCTVIEKNGRSSWMLFVPHDVDVAILTDAELKESGYEFNGTHWVKKETNSQLGDELKKLGL